MTHAQDPSPLQEPTPEGEDAELRHASELLARTVRFLARCAEDPEGALRSEDPRELVRELEVLAQSRRKPGPAPTADATPETEPRTIPIQRRRSA